MRRFHGSSAGGYIFRSTLILDVMYEVVIGVDTNPERAVVQAEAVADLPAASEEVSAVIVHVFQDNPEGASVNQLRSVQKMTDHFEQAGIEYELVERSGDPTTQLIDVADDRDADALCIGGRKRSPAGKALFGSVTQSVLLNTDRTVFVAGVEE